MSYILEALRRAEAERQRGAVPHLHAQPALAGAGDLAKAGRWSRGLWLGGPLAALLVLAGLGWWVGRDKAVVAPVAVPTLSATPPPPAAIVAPMRVPVLPAAPVARLGMSSSPPPMLSGMTATGSAIAPAMAPVAPTTPPLAKPAGASAPVVAAPGAPSAPVQVVTPVASIPTLAELPAALRQGLPPLTLGGIVHSAQAAQRLVILNGQVLHEGDRPTPELQVEQIRPRSVVLSFRGQAFELAQ